MLQRKMEVSQNRKYKESSYQSQQSKTSQEDFLLNFQVANKTERILYFPQKMPRIISMTRKALRKLFTMIAWKLHASHGGDMVKLCLAN
jgi:hypothetical protein